MNKRLIITGFLILIAATVLKLVYIGLSNLEIDDFHPASVIFVVDASASNQANLDKEIDYLKTVCTSLDPEDSIKILRVSESSYLIYEGSPMNNSTINKTLKEFTRYDDTEYGTAYGEAIKKAFEHALNMKKEGYIPSIVVIGDLENEGDASKQIDWDTLPQNVKKIKNYIPEISMMFVYAHPQKLDLVKSKLTPVLGEKKLIVANEQTVDKSRRKLLEAIGR